MSNRRRSSLVPAARRPDRRSLAPMEAVWGWGAGQEKPYRQRAVMTDATDGDHQLPGDQEPGGDRGRSGTLRHNQQGWCTGARRPEMASSRSVGRNSR